VAVLALVIAMAGTSYAALQITSGQIKNNTIKSKDIKDGQVTGKDVEDGSVSGTDLGDGTVTGADIGDGSVAGADIKDGSVTSADLDRTCAATAVAVLGACIDKASTGTAGTLAAALADCDARRGRLMTYQEFKLLVAKPGVTWANDNVSNYEVIDLQDVSGTTVVSQAINFGGTLFGAAVDIGSTFYHRCVTSP
jgi:hypothetical protein